MQARSASPEATSPSPRPRAAKRTLTASGLGALTLLVLAVGGAGAAIAVPLLRAMDSTAETGQRLEQIAALERVSRARPGGATAPAEVLLAADTSGRASADLQLHLSETAKRLGIQMRSAQVLTLKREGDLAAVGLELGFVSSLENLRGLLHAIETELPILIIDELNVRVSGGSEPARTGQLETSLKLRGFAGGKETR